MPLSACPHPLCSSLPLLLPGWMHSPEIQATFVSGREKGCCRGSGESFRHSMWQTNIVGSDFSDLQRASLSWHLSRCEDSGCGNSNGNGNVTSLGASSKLRLSNNNSNKQRQCERDSRLCQREMTMMQSTVVHEWYRVSICVHLSVCACVCVCVCVCVCNNCKFCLSCSRRIHCNVQVSCCKHSLLVTQPLCICLSLPSAFPLSVSLSLCVHPSFSPSSRPG